MVGGACHRLCDCVRDLWWVVDRKCPLGEYADDIFVGNYIYLKFIYTHLITVWKYITCRRSTYENWHYRKYRWNTVEQCQWRMISTGYPNRNTNLQCRAKWLRDSGEKPDKLVKSCFNKTKIEFMQYFPLSPYSMLTSDNSQQHGLAARQHWFGGGGVIIVWALEPVVS